ncbi:hypothetical protein JHK85_056200 [Glycine max]|nr:hypothetical protein JHK85_056200 [Glycine max]
MEMSILFRNGEDPNSLSVSSSNSKQTQTLTFEFSRFVHCTEPQSNSVHSKQLRRTRALVLALADWFCSLRMCLLRELVACFWLLIMELIVIDDVLSAMVGIEGRYILIKTICGKSDDITFLVDPSMDLALQELAKRIFPLCKSFLLINQFVESRSEFQSGLVNHAFSAALRALLLETGSGADCGFELCLHSTSELFWARGQGPTVAFDFYFMQLFSFPDHSRTS